GAGVARIEQLEREGGPGEILGAHPAAVVGIVELAQPLPRDGFCDGPGERAPLRLVAQTHASTREEPRAVDPGGPPPVATQTAEALAQRERRLVERDRG